MQIKEVTNAQDLKSFLELPKKIYAKEPNYIPPLNMHTKMMLGSLGEKDKKLFLAFDAEGKPQARLATKTHNTPDGPVLHFGFFEAFLGQDELVEKLFSEANSHYPNYKMIGPYHFVMEDPYVGNLVHGHAQDPYIFMPFSMPYYDSYYQKSGFKKAMDLQTFLIPLTECPRQIQLIAKRGRKRGAEIRWLNPKKMKDEVKLVADIFNDALSENWGFEPITDAQLEEMYLMFKYIIDPRLVNFIVKDGKEIGCLILLPNQNQLLKKAQGKLSLSFIWNFLTQKNKYDSARGYALGMRKGHAGTGNVCLLIDATYERVVNMGLKFVEISWVLENNREMTELSQSIGGYHNKTYRIYEKALA